MSVIEWHPHAAYIYTPEQLFPKRNEKFVTSPATPASPEIGYRGATARSAAGISYRQLDYWARTGLVEPSVRSATGSGTSRLYGFRDICASPASRIRDSFNFPCKTMDAACQRIPIAFSMLFTRPSQADWASG